MTPTAPQDSGDKENQRYDAMQFPIPKGVKDMLGKDGLERLGSGEPKCLKAHCKCMYGEAGGCPNHHYSQCNTASPVEGSGDGVEARIKDIQFSFDERHWGEPLTPIGQSRGMVTIKFTDSTAISDNCTKDSLGSTIARLVNTKLESAIELLLLEAKAEAELGLIADCNRWRNIPGGIEQVLDDREAELQSNLKKGQE